MSNTTADSPHRPTTSKAIRRFALRDAARDSGRGVASGLAGTTAMTATLKLEQLARRRACPRSRGPVDYDASDHVVTAASTVLRHTPRTPAGRTALSLLVHWGYGSAVAAAYPALHRQLGSRPKATVLFYLGCQAMAMTLFPTLGGTPPPWRWRRAILLSSLGQHAVYAVTVSATDILLSPAAAPSTGPRRREPRSTSRDDSPTA